LPRANASGPITGSSAPRIASDQSRSGARSSCGTSSRLPITSIGIAAAKSSIRSTSLLPARRSSSRSTSAIRSGSIAAIARGDKAPIISRRTRVWAGGSLNTRLVVWCSYNSEAPYFGANSRCLSDENSLVFL
jgi:hypothetical protein